MADRPRRAVLQTKKATARAGQLFAAADRVPFAGPALPRLALRRFTCKCCLHLKARGRLSSSPMGGLLSQNRLLRRSMDPSARSELLPTPFGTRAPAASLPVEGVGHSAPAAQGLMRSAARSSARETSATLIAPANLHTGDLRHFLRSSHVRAPAARGSESCLPHMRRLTCSAAESRGLCSWRGGTCHE